MKEVARIFDLIDHYPGDEPDPVVFASRTRNRWHFTRLSHYKEFSRQLSRGLLAVLQPGDRVATVSNNRPEWNFLDMAIGMAGMVHVPIYPTLSDEEFRYIFVHAGIKLLFVSSSELHRKIAPLAEEIRDIIGIYTFDKVKGCPDWNDFITTHALSTPTKEFENQKNSVSKDQLFSIIYTSGSTGQPKGVMLSHNNILSNLKAVSGIFPMTLGDRALSILPLCHITERLVNYVYQSAGVRIFYAKNWNTILQDLQLSRAQGSVAVPRVLEKILEKIQDNAQYLKWQQRWGVKWAINLGEKYRLDPSKSLKRRLNYADRKVYIEWRKALGGPKKFVACGGAHLSPRILKIFLAAGFPIYEGYGMTETSPLISINHFSYPESYKIGAQGKPLDNVEVRIAQDGEILVKGPNVMLGYYREPELTQRSYNIEGWFRTGDLGHMDSEGFLTVTGRKKDLFKTSGGKYIAPLAIENAFLQSPLIDKMVVVGENQKFPGAIIQPNFEFLVQWAKKHKIKTANPKELIRKPKIIQAYEKEISRLNRSLSKTEQIKDFRLVKDQWSIPSGELSSTLKVKRFLVIRKYEKLAQSIYRPGKKKRMRRRAIQRTRKK